MCFKNDFLGTSSSSTEVKADQESCGEEKCGT